MRWLQGTFAARFNRLRSENGHLFQGRYRSLIVDPAGLGALCHYIHLNPVRAKVRSVSKLKEWPWSSYRWLATPKYRPKWYRAEAALEHAGNLVDTSAGRAKYEAYLAWLSEDETAQKEMKFESMSLGWVIGTKDFKAAAIQDHAVAEVMIASEDVSLAEAKEELLGRRLKEGLATLNKTEADLRAESKSEPWKVGLAAAMKLKTTATNRWLSERLNLGHPDEVSRKVNAWLRNPDPRILRKFDLPSNPVA
jgi:hypothetical protein